MANNKACKELITSMTTTESSTMWLCRNKYLFDFSFFALIILNIWYFSYGEMPTSITRPKPTIILLIGIVYMVYLPLCHRPLFLKTKYAFICD